MVWFVIIIIFFDDKVVKEVPFDVRVDDTRYFVGWT